MIKFTAEFLTTAFFSKVSHSSVVLLPWLNTVHSTCSTEKNIHHRKRKTSLRHLEKQIQPQVLCDYMYFSAL